MKGDSDCRMCPLAYINCRPRRKSIFRRKHRVRPVAKAKMFTYSLLKRRHCDNVEVWLPSYACMRLAAASDFGILVYGDATDLLRLCWAS
jgi:hypothetical protein